MSGLFKCIHNVFLFFRRKETKSSCGASAKKNLRWYHQPVKTPKKNRKSLALRSTRNRSSPYNTSLNCQGGKLALENPILRSSTLTTSVEGENTTSEFGKVWLDFGKVRGRYARVNTPDSNACSCKDKEISTCGCKASDDNDDKYKRSEPVSGCQFGSTCKSKLVTFRTLATIVEESTEAPSKEGTAEKNVAKESPCKKKIRETVVVDDKRIKSGATRKSPLPKNVPRFSTYRDVPAAANLPETSLPHCPPTPSQRLPSSNLSSVTARSSASVHPENRVPPRPEYSCSQEARMAEGALPDDTSVDDLAGYFDSIVYIPRKMSAMAEMMYT